MVKDYAPIAKNALTILVNVSEDEEILKNLSEDDVFLESLLRRVTVCQSPMPPLFFPPTNDNDSRTQKNPTQT